MAERGGFLDDLAAVAGGAVSAVAGLREEAGAVGRARLEALLRRLDLVRREEFDVAMDLAANARAATEALEARLAVLEARLAALEDAASGAGGGPGALV